MQRRLRNCTSLAQNGWVKRELHCLVPGDNHRSTERVKEEVEAKEGGRCVLTDAEGFNIDGVDDGEIAVLAMPNRRGRSNEARSPAAA